MPTLKNMTKEGFITVSLVLEIITVTAYVTMLINQFFTQKQNMAETKFLSRKEIEKVQLPSFLSILHK